MDTDQSMEVILGALEKTQSNFSTSNSSLRSQYYGRFRTLVSQCLTGLLGNTELDKPENGHLKCTLIKLKLIMEAKLRLTAEEENQKERMLFRMYQENEKIEQKMDNLKRERVEGEIKFDNLLKSKLEVIEKNRNFINFANEETRSRLNNEIQQSESNIQSICLKNIEEKYRIEQELEEAQEKLQNILCENLEKEQKIRQEKLGSQQQLKKILDEYDQEVGSRTKTVRELNSILEREEEFLRKLEKSCYAQEIKYNALMLQKETEEKQMQEERMLLFMMNRAARIIQRNWRLVMAKKRLKKGKRKGKKKG